MRLVFKKLRFLIEFCLIVFFFILISILPSKNISKIGGKIFRICGRFTKNHRTALKNCRYVFPNLDNKEIKEIVFKSWENLGKTFFELTMLNRIIANKNSIKINGLININQIIEEKKPSIFFSIHHSNWEICVPTLDRMGINIGAIYRHINNNFLDMFVFKKRMGSLTSRNSFYTPKGKKSAKDILEAAKKNNSIFLLIDQKDSSGENIKLFNKDIKTQIGFLKIARKYNMPIIPMENKRLEDDNFEITFHKPIFHSSQKTSDIDMMHNIHLIIENWIISNPDQWFWQHNRFN